MRNTMIKAIEVSYELIDIMNVEGELLPLIIEMESRVNKEFFFDYSKPKRNKEEVVEELLELLYMVADNENELNSLGYKTIINLEIMQNDIDKY